MANVHLNRAKKAKDDEFYTRYIDIAEEMRHHDFRDKSIHLPCDDYRYSQFFRYFHENFDDLGLRELVCTGYHADMAYQSRETDGYVVVPLRSDGDFRHPEITNLMRQSDIIITNPPFSLMSDFTSILYDLHIQNGIDFMFLGPITLVKNRHIFRLFRDGIVNAGTGKQISNFGRPVGQDAAVATQWYSTLPDIPHRLRTIPTKCYNPVDHFFYDNFKGIECGKVKDIPINYDGIMCVPISYYHKHNPNLFRIVGMTEVWDGYPYMKKGDHTFFARILLQYK